MYAPVGLDEVESRLYEVLLAECVEYYVRIVRSLPVFEERAAGELLLRVRPRWRPRWRASRNACRTVRCSLFAVRCSHRTVRTRTRRSVVRAWNWSAGTLAAVAWARARPDIDGRRIGLWGASQAGWVMPKVAARDAGLRFVIAVAPAIDWQRQGRYNLLAELRRDGASDEERAAALHRRETTLRLLRSGASVEEYRDAMRNAEGSRNREASGSDEGMTADRWQFIAKNYTSDASADLRAMRGTPVLLVLGGHDTNVDIAETERTYRAILPPGTLEVRKFPDATHSLVRHDIERSETALTLTALFAPRALFADGVLTGQRRFLERL
ncbi:alpha/beta hydrolase family protein [Streptomyces sp. NPDC001750]|uniref:alpha/beta hydrolase family protein n=1 Tax=Streptomyces sp. NPDC001750 TaxID=3364607 RepID=UPI00367E46D3